MKAWISIAKVDTLRPLLETHGERLTSRQHLSDIPALHDREIKRVKSAIAGKPISITFDDTKKVCEAMVIIVRVVDADFSIHQYSARLMLAAKSLTRGQITHTCVHTVATAYQVQPTFILAAMHDRASVNDVAVRTIRPLYLGLMDVGCFAHTINHVGGAIKVGGHICHVLDPTVHSPKSRLEFRIWSGVPKERRNLSLL